MTQDEIAAKHLHIADGAAAYFWDRRRGQLKWLRVDREELGGMAMLAFAQAVANWSEEKSPGGMDGLGPYLVQQTRWRLGNAIDRLGLAGRCPEGKHLVSMHDDLTGDGATLAAMLAEEDPDLGHLERHDQVQSALRRLDPVDRACVQLVVGQGFTLSEAKKRTGMSEERIRQRVHRGLAVARATPTIGRQHAPDPQARALRQWWEDAPPSIVARVQTRQVNNSTKANQTRAEENRILGVIEQSRYYLHDPAARTITGPFVYSAEAASSLGLGADRFVGRSGWISDLLGWPDLTVVEATTLDHLIQHGPKLISDLMGICGRHRHRESVRRALANLAARGWVRVVGRTRVQHRRGPSEPMYGATPAASSARGPVHRVEIVRGSLIAHLAQAEGYRMIRGGVQS